MPRTPPPDLPSMLLDGRIVYIGMFLVLVVTEMVVAELMYLQWLDPKEPVYIYINSTGTTRDDGETMFFTLASVSPTAATATPPPYANSSSSSPATFLPHSASSDFSVDNFVVDNKNAPSWLLQPFLTELAVYLWKEQPRHEVPPTFRRVLSSRLRRLAAQGKLPKVSNSKHVSL
ncbi:hypothetical protein IGI04_026185 [Brassica rapa subsp. trilocularis]|uniref:ATP-dependent Clp protease proteolytic subunit n=1 Tax=Brassica rapa subsp. trilocularis TaxID=1813537 RepID=A0ABQ7KZ53_BRACM|nr:hypothetical protein IGI04_026185 [Brassica rapa subsp. trilocularis]